MKFKIDENIPQDACDLLRGAGHDAVSVYDQSMSGAGDQLIATACRDEARALITLDLGFADVREFPPADYAGIVVLRLARQDRIHVLARLRALLALLASERLAGFLWVVEAGRVRIRGPHEPGRRG